MIEGQPQHHCADTGRNREFSGLVIEGQPQPPEGHHAGLTEFSGLVIEGQPQPNGRLIRIGGSLAVW